MSKCPLCEIDYPHSHFSYDIAEYVETMQAKLDIAVEAMQYALNDPYVVFGAYYTKKKLQEALKRLEQK